MDTADTVKFFIDYIIDGGHAPPDIDVKDHIKEYGIMGNTLKIEVEVDSRDDIASVQVCFRYLDIVGSTWEIINLKKVKDDTWKGVVIPGVINSKVDYYIIVNLEGNENIWFSSKIYTAGLLISNFTVNFYILLIAFIVLPAIYLISRRYKKDVLEIDEKKRPEAKKYLLIEIILIFIIESLFFISLLLPWIVYEDESLVWTHIYLFNNIFTYKLLIGEIALILTALYLIGWISYSHLSIKKPGISGMLKLSHPIYVLIIFGSIIFNTGLESIAYPGVGLYLMMGVSVALLILSIWKRFYQIKLGIRNPKTKWYNIDRWLGIKNPIKP